MEPDSAILIPALKGQAKSLNLSNKKLKKIPRSIGRLKALLNLKIQNNFIDDLPDEFGQLSKLEQLNLGNNALEVLPKALGKCASLQKLHLFNNILRSLDPVCLGSLQSLTSLNLNNNCLEDIPPEICRLTQLHFLSVEHNALRQLPFELCALGRLEEAHFGYNQLESLPLEFGYLLSLQKLYLQHNRIRELPESISKLYKLRTLDVAANELRIFPTEIGALPLRELYAEENPLLQDLPVHSVQEEEVLALKEIVARYVMKNLRNKHSPIRRAVRQYPAVREMLAAASRCAVCGEAFLNTWLEFVHFVDASQMQVLSGTGAKNAMGNIPVRALLCSYRCFNSTGHSFYGVAFP